jgi:hypothetical protein
MAVALVVRRENKFRTQKFRNTTVTKQMCVQKILACTALPNKAHAQKSQFYFLGSRVDIATIRMTRGTFLIETTATVLPRT